MSFKSSCKARRAAVVETLEERRLLAATLVGTFTNTNPPPATGAIGEFANASYTVQNTGNSSATSFLPIFILEQNVPAPGAGGDISFAAINNIGTSDTTSALAAGTTATETLEFVLPQNLSGTYYIVGEFSTTNFFASAPINVNGTSPTLTPAFVAGSVPATAAFGSTITPQLQISNTGTAQASGQELTDYYLSTSNSPAQSVASGASGVYFLGTSSESVDLAVNQGTTETPSLTLPNAANIPTGTYYLVAKVNQASPPIPDLVSENFTAISGPIQTTPAVAGVTSQLAPSLSKTKLATSLLSSSKTPMVANVSIQNQGTSRYHGSTRIILFLSQNSTLDSNAVPIVSVPRTLLIGANRTVTIPVRLGSVPAIANGSYYLLAEVMDSSGNTNSAASSGTISVAAPFVALAASLAPLSAKALKTGATLELHNSGNVLENTVLSYTLEFSIDSQGVQTAGGNVQGRFAGRVEIRPNATIRLHVTGWSKIASTLPAGQFYLTVFVQDASGNTSLAVSLTPVTID